ncbi:MAG: hypothetical protein JWN71_3360 [Xanthobacteraceae bacterium]|jgi:hypothetical protein|nr:hypothetical protein [Xanthobacteraceae bacterium]
MAKDSMVTDAKNTVVEAAKAGAEGMKTVAGEALGAAAVAAAGVMLDHVSKALSQGADKVETSRPAAERAVSDAAVSFAGAGPARKKAKKAKKAAKKAAAKASPAKKTAKKSTKKKSAKKTVKKAAKKKAASKTKTATKKKAAKKSSAKKTKKKSAPKKKSGAKRKTKK